MSTTSWDKYFMEMLPSIASKSKDQSTKCGCIIVGPDNEIRSTGYNSFPRGLNDNLQSRQERPEKYFWFEHAERNAIYNAARCGIPLKGCHVYITGFPCCDCARAIVQAGIVEVIYDNDPNNPFVKKGRWEEHYSRSIAMFKECKIVVRECNGHIPWPK